MRVTALISILVVAFAFATTSCNIETTPDDGGDAPAARTGEVDLTEEFHLEGYGIGASWYDYDSQTHAVTPSRDVYRVSTDQTSYVIDIITYYDDNGESGFPTLDIRKKQGEEWGDVQRLQIDESIKEKAVCVALDMPATVDCAGDYDLVLKTDLRIVPAAGFAVQNPAIYTSRHFSESSRTEVSVASADTLETVPEEWEQLPDAMSNRGDALLGRQMEALYDGESTDVLVQATAGLDLVIWWAEMKADGSLAVSAKCADLQSTPGAQSAPAEAATETSVIAPDAPITLVDLCTGDGPEVVESTTEAYRGRWPPTDTFDLFVERFDGKTTTRLPPGQLLWSAGEVAPGDVTVPDTLWN